jgi:hypothetical protein
MSFDARSLERLQQLGRSLPKPLPKPDQAAQQAAPGAKRHRVETETNPDLLFHELIKASEDGTVPPHLLDRLRQAEKDRQRSREAAQRSAMEQLTAQRPGSNTASGGLQPRGASNELRPNRQRRTPTTSEELELYTAFQQLLLEGDEEE